MGVLSLDPGHLVSGIALYKWIYSPDTVVMRLYFYDGA